MQSDVRKTAVAVVCATIIWESADAFMDILVGLIFQLSLSINKNTFSSGICMPENLMVHSNRKDWLSRT